MATGFKVLTAKYEKFSLNWLLRKIAIWELQNLNRKIKLEKNIENKNKNKNLERMNGNEKKMQKNYFIFKIS